MIGRGFKMKLKAPWQPLPQSAVSLSRQRAVREAVTQAADLLSLPAPHVVIAPTKAVGLTRVTPPQSVRMDTYLAAHAPEMVVQALVAHEMGHLVTNRPSDRGSRLLATLAVFVAVVLSIGVVWTLLVLTPGHPQDLATLALYGLLLLTWSLLIASRRMLRPLERAADAVSVNLVGSDAFVTARRWVATHYHSPHQGRLWRWVKEAIDTHPPTAERIAMAQKMAVPPGPLLEALGHQLGHTETAWERRP